MYIASLPRVVTAGALLIFSTSALAEPPDQEIEEISETTANVGKSTERIIVPVPITDPQLGAGLGLGVAWFYSPQGSKVPWATGAGALKTSNGSWAVAAFHKMSIADDKFRVEALGGRGSIESKYYGTDPSSGDAPADMVQDATYIRLVAMGRIARHLFAGAKVKYVDQAITLTSADDSTDGELESLAGDTRILTLGPTFVFDSTDAGFARKRGVLVKAEWLFSDSKTADDFNYSKLDITANQYFQVRRDAVLVFRQSLCGASDGTPFFDLCLFGSKSNLRGYETGEYRDKWSWSIQSEWRQQLTGKLGMVAFAGLGGVAESLSAAPSERFLPSAGIGARYLVAKENGVNLRLDYAWGRSSSGVYVSIGEAF